MKRLGKHCLLRGKVEEDLKVEKAAAAWFNALAVGN